MTLNHISNPNLPPEFYILFEKIRKMSGKAKKKKPTCKLQINMIMFMHRESKDICVYTHFVAAAV